MFLFYLFQMKQWFLAIDWSFESLIRFARMSSLISFYFRVQVATEMLKCFSESLAGGGGLYLTKYDTMASRPIELKTVTTTFS